MKHERTQAGWSFWFQWLLATTVGLVMAGIVGAYVDAVVLALGRVMGGAVGEAVGWFAGLALSGALGGAVVGAMQWLVLRRQVSSAAWWMLASAVGSVLGLVVLFGLGIVVGMAQWLVLRRWVPRAGWWVLASTVGWGVWWGLLYLGALMGFGWGAGAGVLPFVFVFAGMTMPGAITGIALVWLLRQSPQEV